MPNKTSAVINTAQTSVTDTHTAKSRENNKDGVNTGLIIGIIAGIMIITAGMAIFLIIKRKKN